MKRVHYKLKGIQCQAVTLQLHQMTLVATIS